MSNANGLSFDCPSEMYLFEAQSKPFTVHHYSLIPTGMNHAISIYFSSVTSSFLFSRPASPLLLVIPAFGRVTVWALTNSHLIFSAQGLSFSFCLVAGTIYSIIYTL